MKIAVFADIDLSLLDGSAVWLQSATLALAGIEGAEVTLFLNRPARRPLLLGPLEARANIKIETPSLVELVEKKIIGLSVLVQAIARADAIAPFDMVLVRGTAALRAFSKAPELLGRTWAYLTDVPQSASTMTPKAQAELNDLVAPVKRILCQTEELRSFLESALPAARGKALLLPPMVPDEAPTDRSPSSAGRAVLKAVYAGKFAPAWKTLEIIQTFEALRDAGHDVELHLIGDKFHRTPSVPDYPELVEAALAAARATIRHGGLSRAETLEVMRTCDIGIGWRDRSLDSSLELSTKALEYAMTGAAPVLNRTQMHEGLFGADYPLFMEPGETLASRIQSWLANPAALSVAREAALQVTGTFRLSNASKRLERYLAEARPRLELTATRRRILVSGHDLKFAAPLIDALTERRDIELRVAAWRNPDDTDELRLRDDAAWADVVWAEWCLANAVWHSRHKRPGQRLVVRLHRFEETTAYPREVDVDALDQMIFVSEYYRSRVAATIGLPDHKARVIPNAVAVDLLDRPKLPGAPFVLGLLGALPKLKRLDRALDLLAEIRRSDPRFRLTIKSALPWEVGWVWRDRSERAFFIEQLRRLDSDPRLKGAVDMEPHGKDVGRWARRVGWILSTSDIESFHLALAEGMASGAVGLCLPWEGSHELYPTRTVLSSVTAAAEEVRDVTARGTHGSRALEDKAFVREHFALDRILPRWLNALLSESQ